MQLTVPTQFDGAVLDACMVAAGGEAPKLGTGRKTPGGEAFKQGRYWPMGMEFHSGGRPRSWLIVQGEACTLLGFEAVRELGRASMMGASVTRLDVRRDVRGDDVQLVRQVEAACEGLQLRRTRQFTTYPIKSADGDMLGRGVLLGSYASPKFVRCYDKGLETGTAPEGRWVRFEAQLRQEMAHKAACRIFGADDVDSARVAALEVLHGIVDFRIGPRGDGVHVDELPRPGWWDEFLTVEGVRMAASEAAPDLERWRHAVQIQYLAVLVEASRRAGVPLADALAWAADGAAPTAGTRDNPMVGLIAGALGGTLSMDS